jgi:hypothetical protein
MELAKELKRAKPNDDKLKDHKLRFASKFPHVLQGKKIHKYMKLIQGSNLNENKYLEQNPYVYCTGDT